MSNRVQIPERLANEVLMETWSTCCVCLNRTRPVQIHHIDENSSNNDKQNLVALCHECHNQAHLKGGTGRHLTPTLIKSYQRCWLIEVSKIREQVRAQLLNEMSRSSSTDERRRRKIESFEPDFDNALVFIRNLPQIRLGLLINSKRGWSGSTYDVVMATNRYIDSLHELMILIAKHYSPDSFDDLEPEEFILQQWQARQRWARGICTPMGDANSGTIVLITGGHFMINQAEGMVADLVQQIFEVNYAAGANDYGFQDWKKEWEQKPEFAASTDGSLAGTTKDTN